VDPTWIELERGGVPLACRAWGRADLGALLLHGVPPAGAQPG
jgi:hypothetical protein